MSQIVINGNNIDILKTYPDNYFDAVVTDPPYGLGKEPNAAELMKDWVEFGYHEVKGTGFMGKEWDAFVPQPVFWKEVFRVLKHGGHVLSFFGTRTYDWGVMSMRFAGFEVRDCIQWLYGSGFPKSHNIGKAIDKMEGNEREVIGKATSGSTAKAFNLNEQQREAGTGIIAGQYSLTKGNSEWEGWGTALKPANEPIVLARKPLEKGLSVADNILKWGTGGINIDASRIGSETRTTPIFSNDSKTDNTTFNLNSNIQHERVETNQGRFPANIILTHHPECECKGTKKVKGISGGKNDIIVESKFGQVSNIPQKPFDYADADGNETIENWDCHEDCPIRILDEQSGVSKSSKSASVKNGASGFRDPNSTYGEKGGASRFFYVAKASKSERNKGLDEFEAKAVAAGNQAKAELKRGNLEFNSSNKHNKVEFLKNFHPTVKPIKLMQYLVKMITPPNGIVLDPFCGSGTTGIACNLEGFQFVGMEQDAEYSKIAEARINNHIDKPIDNHIDKPTDNEPTINNDDKSQLTLF